ncbi:alpha-amylase family glycosyl hydrolase [Kineothrix sp. MB12-C1]|uniref:alpha-amylase family glycosyl hydrolase n=1 Tax=Kineothrix sp. MB12-C1 TaxID=3070215 RepID=UPI0027D2BA90|nr:alpha-amylase family glycosyl hydrolase [Kineothrix sp. MB12-C1]WMC91850.1 alpha-amylase family glycosyl hydrolase [Kineothrix sp. MB12-C1]
MCEWLEQACFYEIYPQSFYDTDGDGIGDLNGIIEKLDYIARLGCNALWINPCFVSPFYDAGYDVADYCKIAPRYGTNEDARRLFKKAHEKGIRVLFDLVPGHTSIDHEWFIRSMEKKKNEYSGRYIWTENPWEHFAGMKNITGYLNGICERGTCAVNFYTTQPALNYGFAEPDPDKPWQISPEHPDARATKEAMWDIMEFWLSMGCDGFRIDMAHSMIKNDEDGKETIKFWQEIRRRLDTKFPEAVIISEWGEPDRSIEAGFHMDFLLHFGPSHYNDLFRDHPYFAGKGDLSEFIPYYKMVSKKAGDRGLICIPSSNHDMARISRHLSERELKLAFAFLLSMPGAPFIYYGDEIGMRYMEELPSVEGGYERTGSRTPMQWDRTLNAGFSSARTQDLYLPVDPEEDYPDVATQMSDPDSLYHTVKEQIRLRKEYKSLHNYASVTFIQDGTDGKSLVYLREGRSGRKDDSVKILVAINPSKEERIIPLEGLRTDQLIYQCGQVSAGQDRIEMEGESAAYFTVRED